MVVVADTQAVSPARRIGGFGKSTNYSLGVEEEFQLLNPESFELVPVVEQLLSVVPSADNTFIKHELMQSVVETSTRVCENVEEATDHLAHLRSIVIDRARDVGAVLASAGTTPISRWEDQLITEKPRYRQIISKLQWIARRELIFGLHVHVGVDSAEKCIYVLNAIREDLPLLLALSVNSPFWQGELTGLCSSRIKVFDAFPRSGMPPAFDGGWDEFSSLLERGARSGLIPDHTYLWWDVRPHPGFGTIEVRICDAQTRLGDTAALAALVQALVAWHGDRFDAGARHVKAHPQLLLEENRWSAARNGLDGEMVHLSTDSMMPTRQMLAQLLDRVEPVSRRLNSGNAFDGLSRMLDRSGAARQRDAWLDGGRSNKAAARQLVVDTAAY